MTTGLIAERPATMYRSLVAPNPLDPDFAPVGPRTNSAKPGANHGSPTRPASVPPSATTARHSKGTGRRPTSGVSEQTTEAAAAQIRRRQKAGRSKAQERPDLEAKLRWTLRITSLALALGAVAAFGVAPRSSVEPLNLTHSVKHALPLPDLSAQLQAASATAQPLIRETRIRRDDTIGTLLTRLEIQDAELRRYIMTDTAARKLLELKPGRSVIAATDADGRLQWLKYLHTPVVGASDRELSAAADRQPGRVMVKAANRAAQRQNDLIGPGPMAGELSSGLWIERSDSGALHASDKTFANEVRVAMRSFEVRGSLFASMDIAGIPESITDQIVEIFESSVDFHRDVRRGDRIRVVYETFAHDGLHLGAGRVLAVQIMVAGKRHEAIWFAKGSGSGYYTADGKPIRKTMLRSPVEYTRISSGFSEDRLHPILGYSRAHLGVDYAAPIGTRIRSVADGVVTFVGKQGGYGNMVEIQHAGRTSTLYAHLNDFAPNLAKGQRVAQGDIIGYVGQTGLATGPHLHYEIKVAGEAQDPSNVVTPDAPALSGTLLAEYRRSSVDMRSRLVQLDNVKLARVE